MPSPSSKSTPTTPTGHNPHGLKRISSRVRFTRLQGFTTSDGDAAASESYELARSTTEPGTPNIAEAAAHIRRTLSLASFDTLLALAKRDADEDEDDSTAASPPHSSPSFLPSDDATNPVIAEPSSILPVPILLSDDTPPTSSSYTPIRTHPNAKGKKTLNQRRRAQSQQLLLDLSSIVWRPPGEQEGLPSDGERIFVHAVRKATRSFILSFGLRAGVAFTLVLLKGLSSRRLSPKALLQSIFSTIPLRFSLLFSTFSFIYTSLLHSLRLAPPLSYYSRRISFWHRQLRRSTSHSSGILETIEDGFECISTTEVPFGPPSAVYDTRGGERSWHSAVAGFVGGGVAIYWMKKGERRGMIEQLLVRGMEGLWNSAGLSVPGGSLIVFGLCAGQIMASWLVSPENMPSSYNAFIMGAFQGPPPAVAIQRCFGKDSLVNPSHVERLLSFKNITPENKTSLLSMLEHVKAAGGVWKEPFVPCFALHPDHNDCLPNLFDRFFLVFKHMLPIYASLHFIPQIIFKRHLLFKRVPPTPSETFIPTPATPPTTTSSRPSKIKAPKQKKKLDVKELIKLLVRGTKGTIRSGSFLAVFVLIYHALICYQHQLYPKLGPLGKKFLTSKSYFWLSGFATSLSLLIEEKRRRSELALYVLPRGLSTLYSSARRRSLVPQSRLSDGLGAGVAMAMICDRAAHGPSDLSGLVRRVLYQFT